MIRLLIFLLTILISNASVAQNETSNYYWLKFSDKKGTIYTTNRPEEFLSARAIVRREKENIVIDEKDLPVSQVYLDSLKAFGAQVIHTSKWLNGATIKATPHIYQAILGQCHFIVNSQMTKPGIQSKRATENKFKKEQLLAGEASYGESYAQLALFDGQYLHELGYLGEDILIAVLDAGFLKVDSLSAFEKLRDEHRILGTRDFVDPTDNIYEQHYHGAWVLSTMAGDLDGQLIGTAPGASYYLLRSEDTNSEYIIEEDNWVAAAEYADSLGCDMINSSLGYSQFDDSRMNHTYADMNGNTTRVTQGANIAAQKGMLVFSSAGNEGNDPWHYIIAPADGDSVIGVAAVRKDSIWAPFSSIGPASDGDVKPNLAAVGWNTIVQKSNGSIGPANGTSFSSPVLAGMAACLWQANPSATNMEIKAAIEMSASQYTSSDSLLGYGIPNFKLADILLSSTHPDVPKNEWIGLPNPFQNTIYLARTILQPAENISVSLYSLHGTLLLSREFHQTSHIFLSNLSNLPSGLIVAKIEADNKISVVKLIHTKSAN